MNDLSQGSLLLAGMALIISLGNLLVAYGQNRLRQASTDTQGAELVVKLAEKTPLLEEQLRETIVLLHEARAEVAANQTLIADLKETVQEQKEEIARLKQSGSDIRSEVNELKSSVQTLQTANGS